MIHRRLTSQYRIAIIYDGACGLSAHRAAVDIATEAWDAGSSVRVRRIGGLTPPRNQRSFADRLTMRDEIAEVPEVCSEDLAWANLTLLVP